MQPLTKVMDHATQLLTPARFDIVAKHIYARWDAEQRTSDWGRVVYRNHILAINGGVESKSDTLSPNKDYTKVGLEDFFSQYDALLASIKQHGFNPKYAVPVRHDGVLLDGAHRVAAGIYYATPITINQYPSTLTHGSRCNYSYAYFDAVGMDADTLDFMLLEYITLHPDCYMLIIWPSAQKHLETIRALLTEATQLVGEKQIRIANQQMALNIVQQVYVGEKWLIDKRGMPSGGRTKAGLCFEGGDTAQVMLLHANSNDLAIKLKEDIRKLVGIGKHSVHSTEGLQDTLQVGRLFFNRNSLHHLMFARPSQSPEFWQRLEAYRQALPSNADDFCIHGSSVMEAYGIREAGDCDYVSRGAVQLPLSTKEISLSNEKPKLAGMSVDQAVEDPRNYFYYHGVKFASLQAVMKMKQQRGERKDRRDVRLIKSHVGMAETLAFLPSIQLWWKQRKTRHKIKKRRLLEKARRANHNTEET